MGGRKSPAAVAVAVAVCVFSTVLFGAENARAQDFSAYAGPPRASDGLVAEYFGNITYALLECTPNSRSVRIDLGKFSVWGSQLSYYEYRAPLGEVLRRAMVYGWAACSAYAGDPSAALNSAFFYGPDGALQYAASGLVLNDHIRGGSYYNWAVITDYAESHFWSSLRTTAFLAVAGFVGCLALMALLRNREAIARWYYLAFHPHPAEPIIRAALAEGSVIDARALDVVLGDTAPRSSILGQVRLEQASRLVAAMQVLTRQKQRELEHQAKESYQHAAAYQTQAALAEAAIALEKAKAFLQASNEVSPDG